MRWIKVSKMTQPALLGDPSKGNMLSSAEWHVRGSSWPKGWWRRPLLIALLVSLALHLFVLIFKWGAARSEDQRLKTPLAVVLVNAQSQLAPIRAKRLAQADLNGGGQSRDQMASALKEADPGVARQLESLRDEQARLLSSLQSKLNNPELSQLGKTKSQATPADPFEAELAKRLEREAAEPRKAILTGTSAKSVVYAQYYDAMRKKVEQYGTEYFPRHRQQPLYGELVMLISVNRYGKLVAEPEIKRSSGNPELDRQALAIVNACAPFGAFTPAMVRQLDVIDWVASFNFVKGQAGTRLELKEEKFERSSSRRIKP